MTDYTRAEAELDAKREEGEKRFARLKDETISDPASLQSALDAWQAILGNREKLFYLVGVLYAQGVSIDKSPVEPLLQDQINDTVKELAEHVEAMVEMYLEENSDDA